MRYEGEKKSESRGKEIKFNKTTYSGISGGIRLLIDTGFFNTPKKALEVQMELKKEGYFGRKESIDKLLRVDFLKKRKTLNRIKEKGIWKYAIRK